LSVIFTVSLFVIFSVFLFNNRSCIRKPVKRLKKFVFGRFSSDENDSSLRILNDGGGSDPERKIGSGSPTVRSRIEYFDRTQDRLAVESANDDDGGSTVLAVEGNKFIKP
jgi:hypothetical protein